MPQLSWPLLTAPAAPAVTAGRQLTAIGASQNCSLQRLTAACGSKADPGKWSNPAIKGEFTPYLFGPVHRPNVFQDGSKFRLRCEAHGSISVQEGQPVEVTSKFLNIAIQPSLRVPAMYPDAKGCPHPDLE
jgi:hypothetical protein